MAGALIDAKYQVVRPIGEGGMGAVYEARHLGTGRAVALKTLRAGTYDRSPELLRRFEREAQAVGTLDTPHIVQVFDTGTDPATGDPYLVMELLEGEDLGQLVGRLGPLPSGLALRLLAQACAGVEAAHAAGIVHRDLKPANLFLAKSGDGRAIVKLLDFGIAKVRGDGAQDGSLTQTGNLLGSPYYMSPEQAKGLKTIDHRTDVWSLGCVLYEALTGHRPHENVDTLGQIILEVCSKPLPPVRTQARWVKNEVSDLVRRCTRIDPAERFGSVKELREALSGLLPGGFAIDEAALVPLSAEERAHDAEEDFELPSYYRHVEKKGLPKIVVWPSSPRWGSCCFSPFESSSVRTWLSGGSGERPRWTAARLRCPPRRS